MRFNDFDLNSVFDDFADIAEKEGLMKKKANYTLPASMLSQTESDEIDISYELESMAADEREALYKQTKENELLGEAHPEGNKKLEGLDAKDDLAVIEDLPGLRRRMLEVVNKEVKVKAGRIAVELLKLADKLDEAGLKTMADNLDAAASLLVVGEDFEMGEAKVTNESDALVGNLKSAVGNLFEDASQYTQRLSQQEQNSVNASVEMIVDALAKIEVNMDSMDFTKAIEGIQETKSALGAFWGWLTDVQAYIDPTSYKLVVSYLDRGLELLGQKEAGRPTQEPTTEKPGVARTTNINGGAMMLKVQQKINSLLDQLGYDSVQNNVPETGNQADSETYERLSEVFGLVAGKDYRNWNELLSKLEQKGREMLAQKA